MKSLVIYFSHTGDNYFGGHIQNITKGNTEIVAEYIQEFTGADLFKVEGVKPYPTDYQECCDVALNEKNSNARPEIKKIYPALMIMILSILVVLFGGVIHLCHYLHN